MIFKTSVTEHTGTVLRNLGYHVLNTDRIVKPKAVNGSSSQFFYTDQGFDRRRKPMPVYASATLTTIKSEIDSALHSNSMELKTFPNNDITQSTLSKYIDYRYFIYATPHRLYSSYSWVTFIERFSITKVLVDNSLDDLVSIANGGVGNFIGWDDGVSYFRLQVRGGALFLDQTITDLGFDGSEETDWDNIWEKSLPDTDVVTMTTTTNGVFSMELLGSALHTVSVDWGDGNTDDVALSPAGSNASHSFSGSGSITISNANYLTGIEVTDTYLTTIDLADNLPDLTRIKIISSNLVSFVGKAGWVGLEYLNLNINPAAITTRVEWVNLTDFYLYGPGHSNITTYAEWVLLERIVMPNTDVTDLNAHSTWINIDTFNVFNCAVALASDVNDILIQLDATGMSTGIIYLNNGTNAAPTGAGVIAAAALLGRGVNVLTN